VNNATYDRSFFTWWGIAAAAFRDTWLMDNNRLMLF
jgi:hypothetical protein